MPAAIACERAIAAKINSTEMPLMRPLLSACNSAHSKLLRASCWGKNETVN